MMISQFRMPASAFFHNYNLHRILLVLGLIPMLCMIGCARRSIAPRTLVSSTAAPKLADDAPLFRDMAAQMDIHFTLDNGARGKFYFIESTPAGCAFLDYNNDGYLDVLLIQSGPIPGTGEASSRPHCVLYRNEGGAKFTDVTRDAGLEFDQGFAQGVAVGDYDNDGFPDLFITGYNGCHLLHNDGRGHFQDVTARAGVGEVGQKRYATSAAWGDYDNDGRLDLVVLHYTDWSVEKDKVCKAANGKKNYCSPEVYEPQTPTLYHNNGNGTFTDVTDRAGLRAVKGRGLAVVWIDFNHDGKDDLYIANDLTPNNLFQNLGKGKFKEVGLMQGVAYGSDGKTLAGMGIAVGDYGNDGWESLVVTNFSGQPNSVYRANASGTFDDVTFPSGIGTVSLPYLAFGVEFLDYDRDGWRDLIVGNGHIDPLVSQSAPNVTYEEAKSLYHNLKNGKFEAVQQHLGDLAVPTVTRGLAVGDFDNDGHVDVLTNNQNRPAQLLHNESKDTNHWISLRLEGVKSNRDGAGALVWLRAGGNRYFAECRLSSSFASSSDKRLYFGLGVSTKIDEIEVRWPSGLHQTLRSLNAPADRFYLLREGAAPRPDSRIRSRVAARR